MAEEQGSIRAFQVLNRAPRFRKSLNIHPKIWKRLSEDIQNKIKKVRGDIREVYNKEQPKSSPPSSIPPLYGLNRSYNNITQESDGNERLAAVVNSYNL